MKLIFFGSDLFAVPSLIKLTQSHHQVLGVVTQPDKPAGRGQKVTACPCASAAKKLGLKLFQPSTLKDKKTSETLLGLKPDILVVVAYGKFLPIDWIEAAPHQAINLHPSLLPKYRGAAPMQWALLNGDAKTGVTTTTIVEAMDAGDIYLQCEIPLDAGENFETLQQRLSELGAELLLQSLDGIEKNQLKPKPQNPSQVVFAPKLTKADGHLNFQEPAERLYNKVRALNPWPGTFCYFDDKLLKIFEAAVVDMASQKPVGSVIENKEGLIVVCGQKSLCLLEVQLEGKKKMSALEFLKGHVVPIGTQLK